MERDGKDRERQRDGGERSEERPKELSQRQRSFVARSIEKCEARRQSNENTLPREASQGRVLKPGVGSSVLERDLEPIASKLDQDRPREKQVERELRLLKEFCVPFEGRVLPPFRQEQWSRLSEDQRAQVFVNLERVLAKEQGRPVREVEKVRVVDAARRGWWKDEMARYEHSDANPELCRILIRQDTLAKDARTALTAYLHEARHAYQNDVIVHPVGRGAMREDAKTVQMWQHGKETYPKRELKPIDADEEKEWLVRYRSNALEVDARQHSEQLVRDFYDERS